MGSWSGSVGGAGRGPGAAVSIESKLLGSRGVVQKVSRRYFWGVPEPSVYELVERLGNLLRAAERRAGARAGLQPVHLHALGYVARCNRYSDSPGALQEYLGVTKGTASQTVTVLQERGLLRRRRDDEDARRVHLELTAKGRRLVASALPPRPFEEALADLPAGGRELRAQLMGLLRGLQRSGGVPSFGVCRTCAHFRREAGGFRCGLTGEPLERDETALICREHSPVETGD